MAKHQYGPNMAERDHHLPVRGEKEHVVKGDGMGTSPQMVTPMPEKTVEEAMKMRFLPVRGEKEQGITGDGSGPKPKTKMPMKMNSYKGS